MAGGAHGEYVRERSRGPALCRADRSLSVGQDEPARSAAVRERHHHPARQRARRQFGRRPLAGGARAADVDRAQRRGHVVSRRSVDDPRLPGLGRAGLRGAGCDAGERRRGRRRRARGRARADDQPAVALSRPAQNPAHDLHQQDGHRERAGARRAGGVAVGVAAAAGAAPGAAARRRGRGHRLCRSGQRARLSLSAGSGLRSDPAARRLLGRGARDPQRAHRKARRFRRRAARKAARGDRAVKGGNLPAPDPLVEPGAAGAGVSRLGDGRSRRAPAVEGVAPRDARRRRKPRPGSASPPRASRWRRSSRPITCRIPANCRWRGSGAGRSPRAWC